MKESSKLDTNDSHYSSFNQISRDPYLSNNTSFKDDTQNVKYSTSSVPNDLLQEDSLKNKFIEKAKEDMNILPTEFRNKLSRINSVFVISSCIYPSYFLFNLLRDYPEINPFSKRNLYFSTAIYLGVALIVNNLSSRNYRKSYYHLRSQYSIEQLGLMIDQYHEINRQNLSSDFVENDEK